MKTIAHAMWIGMGALLALGGPAWADPIVTDTETMISECTGHCGVGSEPTIVKTAAEPDTALPVTAMRADNPKPEQTPGVARDAGVGRGGVIREKTSYSRF